MLLVMSGCSSTNDSSRQVIEQAMKDSEQQKRIETMLAEWEEYKPRVERLSMLERDLKMLFDVIEGTTPIPDTAVLLDNIPESESSESVEPKSEKQGKMLLITQPDPEFTAAQSDPSSSEMPEVVTAPAPAMMDAMPMDNESATMPKPSPELQITMTQASGTGEPKMNIGGTPWGLHLASYADKNRVTAGWNGLKKRFAEHLYNKAPLVKMEPVKGRPYYRLRVGPFTSKGEASGVCKLMKAQGQYCSVTKYQGNSLEQML